MRLNISDLLPSTDYAIQVRANDGAVQSEWSPIFEFTTTTDTTKPLVPQNVTWESVGDSFHAEWGAVLTNVQGDTIPITRYEIELIANGITKTDSVIPATGNSKVAYDLSFEANRALFVTPQGTVTFKVRAVDNKELKSDYTTVISRSNPQPGPPTGVLAQAGADQITLSWVAPAGTTDNDIVGYNVYNTADVFIGFVNATTYTHRTTTYSSQTLRVAAVDKFGQVSTHVAANAVTPASPFGTDNTPPADPTAFNVVISDDPAGVLLTQRAVATWTQATDATLQGFHIQWKKSTDTSWRTTTAPKDAQQPFLITTGLDPNAVYNFRIRGFDIGANNSGWVTFNSTATAPAVAPLLVHTLKVGGGGSIESFDYSPTFGFRIDDDEITIHNGRINGQAITTGSIKSSANAQVTVATPIYDSSGNIVSYGNYTTVTDVDYLGNTRPAWTINTQGAAEFSALSIRGNAVLGHPAGNNNNPGLGTYPFTTTIAVTNGSNIATSATGQFKNSDVGKTMNVTGVPGTPVVVSVQSPTSLTMTQFATATVSSPGNIYREAHYTSSIASANYIEGEMGWIIHSDGVGEFRQLVAESMHGEAIIAGTLKADALAAGTVTADLTLSGSFKTSSDPTDVFLNTTNGSTTVTVGANTPTFEFVVGDVGVTIAGPGIPADSTIVGFNSATSVVISDAATATASNVSLVIYRGRTVTVSGDGVILADAAGRAVVTLPTDVLQPATFAGSLVADDIFIKDEFRMFGINNSLGTNAALNLNAGSYVPSTGPRVSYTWDNRLMSAGPDEAPYRPDQDSYVNSPKGLFFDYATRKYMYTFEFYGGQVARAWGPGNTSFVRDGQIDFGVGTAAAFGSASVLRGGMTTNGTNFYFLVYEADTKVWRHKAISRANFLKSGGPVLGDQNMIHIWTEATAHGGITGNPAITQYGGNTYIAKRRPGDGKIVLYRYAGVNINANANAVSAVGLATQGNIQSIQVGKFDFDGVNTYAVVTTSGSGAYRMNYVFRVDASSFSTTNYSFPIAFDENPIGTAWIGTDTDDSSGYFRTVTTNGRISSYSGLAKTDSNTIGRVSMKWRNDGTNTVITVGGINQGGLAAKGVSASASPIVQYPIKRRSKTTFTSANPIPDVGGNSPNSVVFLAGSGPLGAMYRYPEPARGVTSQTITNYLTSDSAGTDSLLLQSVPAKILGTGLEISGDGLVKTNNPSIAIRQGSAFTPTANQWIKMGMTSDPRYTTRGDIATGASSIRIRVAGWYHVSAGVTWGSVTTGRRFMGVLKTTTDLTTASNITSSWTGANIVFEDGGAASNGLRQGSATTVYCNVDDYLCIGVYTDTASAPTGATSDTTGQMYHFLRATMIA